MSKHRKGKQVQDRHTDIVARSVELLRYLHFTLLFQDKAFPGGINGMSIKISHQ